MTDSARSLTGTDKNVVRWGVLGAANIAVQKVIPAVRQSVRSRVVAIAARDGARAEAAAVQLSIERAYGSYDALLADPDVEVIYNPLPNHLHVPWSIRAMEAGKHVLCEKPIALSASDAEQLVAARDRTGMLIGEAFMVRTHPQWLAVREMIAAGRIGALRLVSGNFSYFRRDPSDIRSIPEFGGGALMDIGCYPITISRWLFGAEPTRVAAILDRDPELGVDRLGSAMLEFSAGHAAFSFAGQLVPYQRMQIFGTTGRIEVEIPFNAPPDQPCRIFIDDGSRLGDASAQTMELPVVDQYAIQADHFSAAVRGEGTVPVPLEDALANMVAIDAIKRAAESGRWEQLEPAKR